MSFETDVQDQFLNLNNRVYRFEVMHEGEAEPLNTLLQEQRAFLNQIHADNKLIEADQQRIREEQRLLREGQERLVEGQSALGTQSGRWSATIRLSDVPNDIDLPVVRYFAERQYAQVFGANMGKARQQWPQLWDHQ